MSSSARDERDSAQTRRSAPGILRESGTSSSGGGIYCFYTREAQLLHCSRAGGMLLFCQYPDDSREQVRLHFTLLLPAYDLKVHILDSWFRAVNST
jgi:hypothetical protein